MTGWTKGIELLFMATLLIIVLIGFLVLAGGIASSNPQGTVISIGLLMVSGAQIIISMLLVRVYEKLALWR